MFESSDRTDVLDTVAHRVAHLEYERIMELSFDFAWFAHLYHPQAIVHVPDVTKEELELSIRRCADLYILGAIKLKDDKIRFYKDK